MRKYGIILIGSVALLILAGWLWLSLSPPSGSPNKPGLQKQVDALLRENLAVIVKTYRKIIVLIEEEDSLDARHREAASVIGKVLFHENQQRLSALTEELKGEIETASSGGFAALPPKTEEFLNPLEKFAEWHDADKLVFREVVNQLVATLGGLPDGRKLKAELQARLESDRKALLEIQALYNKELDKIFGRFETRGMVVRREAWEEYVAFLKTKLSRDDIFKEYSHLLPPVAAPPEKTAPKRPLAAQWNGSQLPLKTLVLTFDDGPHPRYTDRIMEILKEHQVKAVFFQVGQNLGSFKKDNTFKPSQAAAASERASKEGFTLANHSQTHPFLPKLAEKQLIDEIEEPNRLLREVTPAPISLFRPPYGAQNEKVLEALGAHNLKSILWNVDSKDWADPIPKSIANRVLREVSKQKRGIILFHDIHERTIEALPLILETLKNDGYQFLAWNGKDFVNDRPLPASNEKAPALRLYRESWAVIVGIDRYKNWPKLGYAANDAEGIKEILVRKFKFKPECITTLMNEEATREKILSVLGDVMGDPAKVKKDDRVFVFFAGHGITRKLPSGRDLGYIVPVDADGQNYQGQCISMTNFQDISEAIPAKHLFFVMDSCYSGLGLLRGAGALRTDKYLREIARRSARQMLTAGGADEQVEDHGPNGHSVFTWTLLQGLEGRADLNGDGYITASELASYVGPAVSGLAKQTPAFGNLPGSEGGEFVFDPKQESEFLSELSSQLDEEAIQLNDQLDQIRKQIAEKSLRNEKLRQELAQARVEAGRVETGKPPLRPVVLTFPKHMERGSAFFKEKKYAEALKEFLAAARLDPTNALAANNAGYMHYKMEQYEAAARWFEKTITLDPRRAIAYANLGDACLNLNRKPEAKKAFRKYLDLAPNSKNAERVRNTLGQLEETD